jgi:hypothetical protein
MTVDSKGTLEQNRWAMDGRGNSLLYFLGWRGDAIVSFRGWRSDE